MIYPRKIVIFHSYVRLPEGMSWWVLGVFWKARRSMCTKRAFVRSESAFLIWIYMLSLQEQHVGYESKETRSFLDGYKLIQTSLLVSIWEYPLTSKEFVIFCRLSKIGNETWMFDIFWQGTIWRLVVLVTTAARMDKEVTPAESPWICVPGRRCAAGVCEFSNYNWLVVWNMFYFSHKLGIIIPADYFFLWDG